MIMPKIIKTFANGFLLTLATTVCCGQESGFNLVLLPDTQNYAQSHPDIFKAQTQWAADNASTISFVLQQGDITNKNNPPQWKVAAEAMTLMDGKVPYTFVPGNHDVGTSGSSDVRDTTLMNEFFPYDKYSKTPNFGGTFEVGRVDNTWHLFKAGGLDWLILSLEFGPRNRVIEWAAKVIEDHPNHKVIINTHAYMYSDETRIDENDKWSPQTYGLGKATGDEEVNDGEEIWEKLASRFPNVFLVVSGHVLNDGAGKLVSTGKAGNKVYQMLANFQSGVKGSENGGNGFLRIVHIDPAAKKMSVKTWSPYLNEYKTDADQEFVFEDVTF